MRRRRQPAEPLAKQAARQDVLESEGIRRVDQHQIEIPTEPAVLKAVIEDDHVDVRLR